MEESTIVSLLEKFEQNIIERVDMTGTATRALMKSEIDRIDDMDKKRNGIIHILKVETSFFRWVQRNYKIAVPAAIIILLLFIKGSDRIDLHKTVENITDIELNE